MTLEAWLAIIAAPASAVGAWVLSVEKRLGLIESIDKKCDLLLEHALSAEDQRRRNPS